MEKKINVAELLKDCPQGMELDCVVYNNLSYDYVNVGQGRIYCKVDKRDTVWFTIYGCVNLAPSVKCVIFPKGKTTWEGFVPPCKFKEGDKVSWNYDTYKQALQTFGCHHQRMMCMEECGELIDALAKYDRGRNDSADVITELADVSIMVEQMAEFFGREAYEAERERKMVRLQELIEREKK